MFVNNLIIDNSLHPEGLYFGQTLTFGRVNYFIGKNGTGKTQILKKIFEKARGERASLISTEKGLVIKYLPSVRSSTISGSRALHSNDPDETESGSMSVESFYQFLNTSPFTKTLVEHQIKEFFKKDAKIQIQGQNIIFSIVENFKKNVRKLVSRIVRREEKLEEAKEAGQEEQAKEIQEEIEELQDDLKELNLSSESDGMKEMFILLTFIYHPRVKVIFIDELETHLHPHMINFITDAIEEMAQSGQKQFFIITHSPTAVKLKPSNEWKYFFFKREEQIADCKISCFDQFNDDEFKQLIIQLNPYKKEAFYSDTVILLEGIDDYYLFSSLTKKLGYSEYGNGGINFFPCWGGRFLESYYSFFQKTNKKIFVIADSNIGSVTQLSSDFKRKFTDDPTSFIKLSKSDITGFCTNSETNKTEKILKEIEIIESDTYLEANYTELLNLIKTIMGTRELIRPNNEFSEMVHRMVNEFQMRFKDHEDWKELLSRGNIEELKNKIQEDINIKFYWQDCVHEEFSFDFSNPWKCKIIFRSGNHNFTVEFDQNSNPSNVYPS
ncbi:MAG: AAA family ATPase [Bacilli bacterium]|nr:AAA family ATPase [Bacilli bacterium]